ncbi:MAG: NADP-dependent phosphogluconate dehydrogenase [Myxococcota bacterium]
MGGEADVGVIGLGVMGANLARNFRSRGLTVAVHNRSPELTDALLRDHGADGFVRCADLEAFAAALKRPRIAVIMVTAGNPVDAVIGGLGGHLDPGDVIVDGGNSHFADTERRAVAAAAHDLVYVGMGVSGGEEGALHGPSLMPGGDARGWTILRPLLEKIAAEGDGGPTVAWCGRGGAGHYTKMVHNGIEYGDMQLVSEVWTVLRDGLGLAAPAQREVFERWNAGRLESFLIEITAGIVAAKDPNGPGPLVEQILDEAGQKGTGRWTSVQAIEQGVPLPTITSAVDARAISSKRATRAAARDAFGGGSSAMSGVTVDDLEHALYAAKLASYAQGFELLRTASDERGYGIDLGEVARIWTAGCIIRAAFLGRVRQAFTRDPQLPLLVLDPSFADELRAALPSWRRVVAAAVSAGIPVPALSASLAWVDAIRTDRGAAAMIQAQRDWFGAHTYRLRSDPDTAVHTEWSTLSRL